MTVIANRGVRSTISEPEVCCASGREPAISGDFDERLAVLTRALGHPARVRIVRLLAEQGSCVTGELVVELALAQSTTSEHLRILREAGLIMGETEGPRTLYCLDPAGLAALNDAVNALSAGAPGSPAALERPAGR